ncbi:MAG TPA: M20/M25/M40 family metallo-hydrolase [Pyrinomonadaceae bacterium]|nr:M20/M25/M40 family metallo-hydrolase [Pyrinomonadaceae bacterium]
MPLPLERIITASLALLLLMICLSADGQQNIIKISTPEDIKADFNSVPCKNDERLAAVKALFEKARAPESDISVEKFKGVENLVVRIRGSSVDSIVIGAHYDKVSDGCGAIDNWTGIVALAHLYATLKQVSLRKTIIFVAFGKEEKGLIGSRAMVDAIARDHVSEYCAMINIDSLGLSPPQVLDNASSKELRELAADVAIQMKIPFSHASVGNADADSSSFVSKKIPALTIHGLNNEWSSIIHSRNDQISKVNPVSVYLGYKLVLGLVSRLDASSCAAYR